MNQRQFLAHFNRISEAPDAIPRLRRFILDLAVRGKLVEQDQKDEPASELLKRIQTEQARLAKEGKIKGHGSLQSVREDEWPFPIPANWRWTHFSEIAAIQSNLVDPRDYREFPHVAPDNIESGTGRLLPYETIGASEVFSPKHLFHAGCILYSKIRPSLAKAVTVDFDGLCSADMYPILPLLNRNYLHQYMLSDAFIRQSISEDNRVAMPKINQASLSKILVAVPPLSEQRRIATRVYELMILCDQLETLQTERESRRDRLTAATLQRLSQPAGEDATAAREHARFYLRHLPRLTTRPDQVKELRQTIMGLAVRGKLVTQDHTDESAVVLHERLRATLARMQKAEVIRSRREILPEATRFFGKKTFPPSWVITNFDSVSFIVSGVAKGKDLRGFKTASYPYLRVANVQRGYLNLDVVKELEVRTDELDRYRLKKGDVLMTEGGDWDKLGRAAIWNEEIPNCIHQNHIYRIRSASNLDLLSEWIALFANSPLGRAYFEGASKQTTNLASINMTQLRSCPLPLPPVAEQHRIVAKVNELMAACDSLETRITTTQTESSRLLEAVLQKSLAVA